MSNDQLSPQDAFVHARLLDLVRSGTATTRPMLEQTTGFSRRVVTQHLQQQIDAGLVEDSALTLTGGRPSRSLRFRRDAGTVLAGVIEATQLRVAMTDLGGSVRQVAQQEWIAADRPVETMRQLAAMFAGLTDRAVSDAWGIGVGISGPVDSRTGRLITSPILPGWDGMRVRAWLHENLDAPAWIETDVNLMALGEAERGRPESTGSLLYVEMDEGIATGFVSEGRILRGDGGAAGGIGHIRVSDDPALLCRCGRTGCLEAIAGGWAIVQRLSAIAGEDPWLAEIARRKGGIAAQDFGSAAQRGDPSSRAEIERAARAVGTAVGDLVTFADPRTVVLGGGAIRVGDWVLAEFERALRARAAELPQRDLHVRAASLDFAEGLIGAALLAVDRLLSPDSIATWLPRASPAGSGAALQSLLAD